MDWYFVIKTIHGRRYRYRQKTWRENGRVRTRSEYIGPWSDEGPKHPDLSGATTLPLRFPERAQLPTFDEQITKRALTLLTQDDCRGAPWAHAWSQAPHPHNEVQLDGRVALVLKNLRVMMADETDGAYYRPNLDIVNIPPQECFATIGPQSATQAYHAVLFHELVHWTGGRGRLLRRTGSKFGQVWYAREELVAELGAVMLMQHFGMELGNTARHARYFQRWFDRAGKSSIALSHAKREAARAVRFILERGIIQT
jgi:antirestriction protein ArdC